MFVAHTSTPLSVFLVERSRRCPGKDVKGSEALTSAYATDRHFGDALSYITL